MSRKVIAVFLSLVLFGVQTGFAEVVESLNLAGHFARSQAVLMDTFRPVHMRYFSYGQNGERFRALLDRGNAALKDDAAVSAEASTLINYFLVGLTLPDSTFWVNLRPDSEENVIEPALAQTDVGRILLEADVQLKKDTALLTSPENPLGKEYWSKLYARAGELFGSEEINIPTLTRPWIVPGEIIVREGQDSVYIYKATLKVLLEEDHLPGSRMYNFADPRLKELNEYSSQLIRELIIPQLTREINTAKRYASLRQVFYSLVIARWFKTRFAGQAGLYATLIDSGRLEGMTSRAPWSSTTYFNEYKRSFEKGEYNLRQQADGRFGQVIRSYFSGGIRMVDAMPTAGQTSSPVIGRIFGRINDFLPAFLQRGNKAGQVAVVEGPAVVQPPMVAVPAQQVIQEAQPPVAQPLLETGARTPLDAAAGLQAVAPAAQVQPTPMSQPLVALAPIQTSIPVEVSNIGTSQVPVAVIPQAAAQVLARRARDTLNRQLDGLRSIQTEEEFDRAAAGIMASLPSLPTKTNSVLSRSNNGRTLSSLTGVVREYINTVRADGPKREQAALWSAQNTAVFTTLDQNRVRSEVGERLNNIYFGQIVGAGERGQILAGLRSAESAIESARMQNALLPGEEVALRQLFAQAAVIERRAIREAEAARREEAVQAEQARLAASFSAEQAQRQAQQTYQQENFRFWQGWVDTGTTHGFLDESLTAIRSEAAAGRLLPENAATLEAAIAGKRDVAGRIQRAEERRLLRQERLAAQAQPVTAAAPQPVASPFNTVMRQQLQQVTGITAPVDLRARQALEENLARTAQLIPQLEQKKDVQSSLEGARALVAAAVTAGNVMPAEQGAFLRDVESAAVSQIRELDFRGWYRNEVRAEVRRETEVDAWYQQELQVEQARAAAVQATAAVAMQAEAAQRVVQQENVSFWQDWIRQARTLASLYEAGNAILTEQRRGMLTSEQVDVLGQAIIQRRPAVIRAEAAQVRRDVRRAERGAPVAVPVTPLPTAMEFAPAFASSPLDPNRNPRDEGPVYIRGGGLGYFDEILPGLIQTDLKTLIASQGGGALGTRGTQQVTALAELITNAQYKSSRTANAVDTAELMRYMRSEGLATIAGVDLTQHMGTLARMGQGDASSPLRPEAAVNNPGGIDFRIMNIAVQPLGTLSTVKLHLPWLAHPEQMDLDKEFGRMSAMLDSGIVPSAERLKEFVAACYQRNEFQARANDVVAYLADLCRLQEDKGFPTDDAVKQLLVLVDTI